MSRGVLAYRISAIMEKRDTCCDRSDNDGEKDHAVRDDDGEVTPFIGEEFRQGKCSKLAITSPESDQHMGGDRLMDAIRGTSDNGSHEDENVTKENEITTTKKITYEALVR